MTWNGSDTMITSITNARNRRQKPARGSMISSGDVADSNGMVLPGAGETVVREAILTFAAFAIGSKFEALAALAAHR
jgi:hypothetical protein